MNFPQQGFPPEGMPVRQAMQQPQNGQMQMPVQQPAGYPPQGPIQYVQTPTGYAPAQQVQPQYAQQPQQFQQQPAPQAPQWQGTPLPQGMPQGQPQPQGAPQRQSYQFTGDEILDGPSIPPELRGRPIKQVMGLYNVLADSYTNNQFGGQQNSGQPGVGVRSSPGPQGPQQYQQQPGYGQQQLPAQPGFGGQQAPDDERRQFFQAPGAYIRNTVQQAIQEAVAPMVQSGQQTRAGQIMQQLRVQVPDYQTLEPEILRSVQGASPEALANPVFWQNAVRLARGTMAERGQWNPGLLQQQQPQGQYQPQFGAPQQRAVPGYQYGQQVGVGTLPPTYAFFSEAPGAPGQFGTHMGGLAPEEDRARQAMGYSVEQWMAWKGGVQR